MTDGGFTSTRWAHHRQALAGFKAQIDVIKNDAVSAQQAEAAHFNNSRGSLGHRWLEPN